MNPLWVTRQGSPQTRESQRARRAVKVAGAAFVFHCSVLTDTGTNPHYEWKENELLEEQRQHRCVDRTLVCF